MIINQMGKFLVFCFTLMSAGMSVLGADETPQSVMRASYMYTAMDTKRTGEETVVEDVFILQIAPRESHYFSNKTYEYECLMATDEGKALRKALIKEATTRTADRIHVDLTKVADRMPKSGERTRVYKYHDKGEMEVFNRLNGDDIVYTVPMEELEWELEDSVKMVLGYECQKAVADYHGRRWNAWFAKDIPVQEGPWQLCGLPGLIMEAVSEGGEFRFEINGLEQQTEPMVVFHLDEDNLYRYKRKVYLREVWKYKEDPGLLSMSMGGMLRDKNGKPVGKIKLYHDLIETDYRE